MPFSADVIPGKLPWNLYIFLKNISLKNVTLQVRIPSLFYLKTPGNNQQKKAFLYSFLKNGRDLCGSLTLEASMALTLFVFTAVCMMLPMKVLNTERKLQAALETIGEDFSCYAYLVKEMEKGQGSVLEDMDNTVQMGVGFLAEGMAEQYVLGKLKDNIDTSAIRQMTMRRSRILEDGETIDLIFDYEIQLPFPVLGLQALQRTVRCCRRGWIGTEPEMLKYDGDGSEAKDGIVYVGKGSTRYHSSRSCHYLSNDLQSVEKESVSTLRNQGGKRYAPCAVCGGSSGNTVYITPSGISYHATQNCRAIVAYVQAVKRSEAEHLGACSYCGGR